jgi:hypothetical protein
MEIRTWATKTIFRIATLTGTIYLGLLMTGLLWLIAVGYCKAIQKDCLILTIQILFLGNSP